MFHRSGHRDITKPTLLFEPRFVATRRGVREDPLLHPDQEDDRKFQALGGVNSHQRNAIVPALPTIEIRDQRHLIEIEFELAAFIIDEFILVGGVEIPCARNEFFQVVDPSLGLRRVFFFERP